MKAPIRTLVISILFAAGSAAVACSSSDSAGTTTDAGTDSKATGSGDDDSFDAANGNPAGDAGSTGDAATNLGADAAGDDSGASPLMGAVYATSDSLKGSDGGALVDYSAGGFFVNQTAPDATLTSTTVGPCVVEVDGTGSPTEASESAGSVSITGGKKPITLTPTASKDYDPKQGTDSNLWNGGETITVTAAGADVPAFTTSLVAPSPITLATPALPASSGSLSVSRSAPWTATWTGTSSGNVVFYFSDTDASHSYTATCKFAASAHSATVPAAAFASFPAGPGSFDFYVETSATAAVPGWHIRFNASSAVVDGAGVEAIGSTTYP